MKNSTKPLRIVTIIFFCFALLFCIVGTVLSFCDKELLTQYKYPENSNGYVTPEIIYYDGEPNPIAGILPFFGLLFCSAALLSMFFAQKNPKLLIGSAIGLELISILFLGFSAALIQGKLGIMGYVFNIVSICFGSIAWILSIVLLILNITGSKNTIIENIEPPTDTTNEQNEKKDIGIRFQELSILKELYESGALTEEEYTKEKEKVLCKL